MNGTVLEWGGVSPPLWTGPAVPPRGLRKWVPHRQSTVTHFPLLPWFLIHSFVSLLSKGGTTLHSLPQGPRTISELTGTVCHQATELNTGKTDVKAGILQRQGGLTLHKSPCHSARTKNGSRLLYPRRELARRGERVCTPHLAHHQELYKRNESAGAWQRWGLPPHTVKPFDGELKKPVTKRYQKTLKMIQVWNENTLTYIHGRFYDHHLTAFTRLLVSR